MKKSGLSHRSQNGFHKIDSSLKLNYFHKNSWIDTDGKSAIRDDSFSLAIAYRKVLGYF
jgi:hypothetical protein